MEPGEMLLSTRGRDTERGKERQGLTYTKNTKTVPYCSCYYHHHSVVFPPWLLQ